MLEYYSLFREERINRGLSQAKLGKLIGITQQHINDIEHGKRKPSLEVLERLCDAFDLEIIIQKKR